MIHKFHSRPNGWEGITPHIYKENPGVFRDVTKQILFDNEADLPVQFRYFQVEKDGFSSLEKHEHMHLVLIFKGKGHALLGSDVHEVSSPSRHGSGISFARTQETSWASSAS